MFYSVTNNEHVAARTILTLKRPRLRVPERVGYSHTFAVAVVKSQPLFHPVRPGQQVWRFDVVSPTSENYRCPDRHV